MSHGLSFGVRKASATIVGLQLGLLLLLLIAGAGVAELEFQTEPALEQALWLFKQAGARDFADCLHIALATQAGKGPLRTFDPV